MRRLKRSSITLLAAVLLVATSAGQFKVASVSAEAANAPSLVISQLKITSSNGQFITLYNATNTQLDMGKYQLEYFNNYDLTKATSSKLISLTGTLPPHGYFMVNDSSTQLCYELTVDSVSLGLSSTSGMVEVLAYNQSGPGTSASPVLQDYVGWSKTAASGAQTLPPNTSAFLQRLPVDLNNNPSINAPGVGSWQSVQPSSSDACNLVTIGTSTPAPTGLTQLLPATEPPATFVNDDSAPPVLAGANSGLMAPLITEVLPNPTGSGNDATDEFIEIYNPNIVSFDLSGFVLQAGTTTLHDFTFPDGTTLPPQTFLAFYASKTHLSLSNSSGQVKLLDASGNTIATTGVYGTADDGKAWALANGKWYWTTKPTPGAPNIIVEPAPKSTAAKTKAAAAAKVKAVTTKVKKAKATKPKAAKKIKKTKKAQPSNINAKPASASSPIKPTTIAVLGGLALLYGVYEYRSDLANYVRQFRRNFKIGRRSRQLPTGRRGD